MLDFPVLVEQCAPEVAPHILERIVKVESSFNPYAIGVVGGRLARQPQNKAEAVATAHSLHSAGWNFSMGLGQVNRYNLSKYGLDYEKVFDPCHNVRAAAGIFNECLQRATPKFGASGAQLAAFSCYYSGNFQRGFKPEGIAQRSYVDRILAATQTAAPSGAVPIAVIPNGSGKGRSASAAKSERGATGGDGRLSQPQMGQRRSGVKELRGD